MTMRKTTLLVTFAALALAGGCGKKKDAATKAPPIAKNPTPEAPKPPPPSPVPAKLTGVDLAKRFLDCHGYWSASDQAKLKDCYADHANSRFVDSMTPENKGPAAIIEHAMAFHVAFPDGKTVPQLVLVNGREIASVLWFTGTNTGVMKSPMGDMPASGKKVGMFMLQVTTFDDANRVTEEWWLMDDNTFGFQLGMNPPGAPPQRPVADKGLDGAPIIVIANDDAAEKANLAQLLKGNDAFNKHDLAAIMADYADGAIESDQGGPADTVGKPGIEAGTKMFLAAFPDGNIISRKAWAAGQYVVSVSTFNGTNTGDMGPMKKTGKPVSMTVGDITKLDSSKITQAWRFYNGHSMMMQLGMAPDPSKMAPGAGSGSAAPSPSGK